MEEGGGRLVPDSPLPSGQVGGEGVWGMDPEQKLVLMTVHGTYKSLLGKSAG